MKKIIKEYEQRNKVISEIQKNLRANNFRDTKSLLKNENKMASPFSLSYANNGSYTVNLPLITRKNDNSYSPKSLNSNKKSSSTILKEGLAPPKINASNMTSKPWIQTISFSADENSFKSPKILISNPSTMKNFMKKSHLQSNNCSSFNTIDHDLFLSPRKITNRSRKQLKTKLNWTISKKYFNFDQTKRSQSLQLPKQIFKQKQEDEHTQQHNLDNNKFNSTNQLFNDIHCQNYYETPKNPQNKKLQQLSVLNITSSSPVSELKKTRRHKLQKNNIWKAPNHPRPSNNRSKLNKLNEPIKDRVFSPWNVDNGDGNQLLRYVNKK